MAAAAIAVSDLPDGRRVLALDGRLDATTVRSVWDAAHRAIDEGRELVRPAPGPPLPPRVEVARHVGHVRRFAAVRPDREVEIAAGGEVLIEIVQGL